MAFVFLSGMVLSAGPKVCQAKWWLCHVPNTSMTSITKVGLVLSVSRARQAAARGGLGVRILEILFSIPFLSHGDSLPSRSKAGEKEVKKQTLFFYAEKKCSVLT